MARAAAFWGLKSINSESTCPTRVGRVCEVPWDVFSWLLWWSCGLVLVEGNVRRPPPACVPRVGICALLQVPRLSRHLEINFLDVWFPGRCGVDASRRLQARRLRKLGDFIREGLSAPPVKTRQIRTTPRAHTPRSTPTEASSPALQVPWGSSSGRRQLLLDSGL